jgi:hypothetical protein
VKNRMLAHGGSAKVGGLWAALVAEIECFGDPYD